jgi:hypothetical protein
MVQSLRPDEPGRGMGTYGFRLHGVDPSADWLCPVESDWPDMRLVFAPGRSEADGTGQPGDVTITDDDAAFWMSSVDLVTLERDPLTVRFATREPLKPAAVAHPFLGLPAVIASMWLGRQVFHGGAFLHEERAWVLLGDRSAGKSTTVACLLQRGLPTVTDDVVILDGRRIFVGPRTIDLREESAAALGGEYVGHLGSRDRWRLVPAQVKSSAELGGFVHLCWGDDLRVEQPSVQERLAWLASGRAFLNDESASPAALLDLVSLPHVRLTRPKHLDAIDEAVDALIGALVPEGEPAARTRRGG